MIMDVVRERERERRLITKVYTFKPLLLYIQSAVRIIDS